MVKNPPANAGDMGLIPDMRRSHRTITKPVRHKLLSLCSRAWELRLLKPVLPGVCAPRREATAERSPRPATGEQAPLAATRESPRRREDSAQPKINTII